VSIWAVTLGLAILIVPVTRGSFKALAQIRLRGLWLLLIAAIIQIGLEIVSVPESRLDDVGFGLLITSYALLLAFGLTNLGIRGMGVVVVGVVMNALVIGLNQGMPVTDKVWRDGEIVSEPIERTVKHRPSSDADLLPSLGDTIVVPEPFNEAISFGDLVLAVGVIDVAYWGSRRRRRVGADERRRVARAARRHRRRAQRIRRDKGKDVLAPEPVFIDLTEIEGEPIPARTTSPERVTRDEVSVAAARPTGGRGGEAGAGEPEQAPIQWTAPPQSSIDLSEFEDPRSAGQNAGRDGGSAGDAPRP
jgi:hypothetical protein